MAWWGIIWREVRRSEGSSADDRVEGNGGSAETSHQECATDFGAYTHTDGTAIGWGSLRLGPYRVKM